MILSFKLSMPNVGSWNGKWTGENNLYAIVKSFGRSIESKTKAVEILSKGYYRFSWNDGWSAGVSVSEVDSKEARKIKRKSSGFSGYEWMVDSIIEHGKIIDSEKKG